MVCVAKLVIRLKQYASYAAFIPNTKIILVINEEIYIIEYITIDSFCDNDITIGIVYMYYCDVHVSQLICLYISKMIFVN